MKNLTAVQTEKLNWYIANAFYMKLDSSDSVLIWMHTFPNGEVDFRFGVEDKPLGYTDFVCSVKRTVAMIL